jgi:hypothetical protein
MNGPKGRAMGKSSDQRSLTFPLVTTTAAPMSSCVEALYEAGKSVCTTGPTNLKPSVPQFPKSRRR